MGKIYEQLEYTPYGELWVEHLKTTIETTPFRFTGKERDSETGLYYFGARYLNPQTSMWLSADPAMGEYIPQAPINDEAEKYNQNLPGMGGVFNYVNLHAYHYAGNNPIKLVDPDGAFDEDRNRLDKDDFKIDKFGLRIVFHYLYGSGKAMIIENDPKWTNMIKNAPAPSYGELAGITLEQQIKNAIKKYVNDGIFDQGVSYFFSISIDAEIDNGEGITGYNYLHHANGGVSLMGLLTINESGVLTATYVAEWNDRMDPNDQYVSDRYKAKFAKIISFGQAKDYYFKLTWSDSTTFNLED